MSISNLEDSVRNETSIFSVTFANRFLQIYTIFGIAGDGGRCPEPFTNDVSTRKVSNNNLKFLTLRKISSISPIYEMVIIYVTEEWRVFYPVHTRACVKSLN